MAETKSLRVRVWVPDVWDNLTMVVSSDTPVSQLKTDSLMEATKVRPDPATYLVKYRGALVINEDQTMADLGAGDGAPFIILPTNRRPVT